MLSLVIAPNGCAPRRAIQTGPATPDTDRPKTTGEPVHVEFK